MKRTHIRLQMQMLLMDQADTNFRILLKKTTKYEKKLKPI
jgi:hypothetical protein